MPTLSDEGRTMTSGALGFSGWTTFSREKYHETGQPLSGGQGCIRITVFHMPAGLCSEIL
jgi:GTPase involved in cell partitioning and DNA repair